MTYPEIIPDPDDEFANTPLLSDEARKDWGTYLDKWEREVYAPLFKDRGIGRDAALTCWFVNRLRNAIPDDDAGDELWKES